MLYSAAKMYSETSGSEVNMDSWTPGFSSHQPNVINTSNTESAASQSHFHQTVCLYDWWLTKSQADSGGSRLAVAGLSSREKEAMRIFISAPVSKRYNDFSLETADGICIIIRGFINKVRTAESGFPSEVFDHFVFGFPPYWERFAVTCFEWDSAGVASMDNSAFDGTDVDLNSRTHCGMTKSGPSFVSSLSQIDSPGSPINYRDKDIPQHETSEVAGTLSNAGYQTQPSVSNSSVISKNEERSISEALVNLKGKKRRNLHATLPSNKKFEDCSGHLASNITQTMPSKRNSELEKFLMDHDSSITKVCEEISEDGIHRSCNGDSFTSPCSLRHSKKKNLEESPVGRVDIDSAHKSNIVKSKRNAKVERSIAKETSKNNTSASPKLCGKNLGISMVSSESSYRKSRSGRLLLPTLEFWRNQLPVYDMDRKIIGIKEGPSMVSVSPPSSKGKSYLKSL